MNALFEAASRGLVLAGFVSLGALLCYAAWWQFRRLGDEIKGGQ